MSRPSTNVARLSGPWWCVLRGSLKEPDGGDRKGGGKGRGARFAKSATPVSNRNGSFGSVDGSKSALEKMAFRVGVPSPDEEEEAEDAEEEE